MSEQIDLGLASTLFRVKQWLTGREQMTDQGDVVHLLANGHELRVTDLKRLIDRLESLPEVSCECHD